MQELMVHLRFHFIIESKSWSELPVSISTSFIFLSNSLNSEVLLTVIFKFSIPTFLKVSI